LTIRFCFLAHRFFIGLLLLTACNFPTATPEATPPFPTLAATETPAPSPTPDQPVGKIVYTCQVTRLEGENQLCLINADGSGQRQLTFNTGADHFYASFAPDGGSIVFSSNQTGMYEIYEMDLAGSRRQLTDSGGAYAPAISPDGALIIYSYNPEDDLRNSSLWLMDRDGGNRYPIAQLAGGAWDATWSPDGTQILFASYVGENAQMFIMNTDGSNVRQVTSLEGLRGRNDWSADGVTLSTYIGAPWNREIIAFNTDGSNVRYLTDGGNNLAPSFSPDGAWIAFTSYRDRYLDDHGCEIYVMRADGGDVRRLTDNDYCDWQPRWGK
jgi:TolB protein